MKKLALALLICLLCPVLLHAQQTKTVTLTWQASPSQGVANYNIYFLSVTAPPCPTTGFSVVGNVASPTLTFTDVARPVGAVSCYAVTAVDTFGIESVFSGIALVDLRPPQPPAGTPTFSVK